jgi:hypothetical protein
LDLLEYWVAVMAVVLEVLLVLWQMAVVGVDQTSTSPPQERHKLHRMETMEDVQLLVQRVVVVVDT